MRALVFVAGLAIFALLGWLLDLPTMLGLGADSGDGVVVGSSDLDSLDGRLLEDGPEAGPVLMGAEGRRVTPEEQAEAAERAAQAAALAGGPAHGKIPVEIRVLDPQGRPSAEVLVYLEGAGTNETLRTDVGGRVEGALPPGRYRVLMRGADGGRIIRSFLVDGSRTEAIEWSLQPYTTAAFELTRGGEPLSGVAVGLGPLDAHIGDHLLRQAETDTDGRAVFENLIVGRYAMSAEVPDGPRMERGNLYIQNERTWKIDVPNAVDLSGTVRRKGGDAGPGPGIAGAQLDIEIAADRSGLRYVFNVESGPDGTFALKVPRGQVVRFNVLAEGYAPYPNPSNRSQRRALGGALSPLRRGRPAKVEIPLEGGQGLTGRATTPDGEAVPDLLLRVNGRRFAAEVTTDAAGRFALETLNTGDYEIEVLSPNWFPEQNARVRMTAEGPQPEEVELVVQAARTLRGRVLLDSQTPAAGARVWLTGGGRVLRSARRSGRELETFTNERGTWVLTDVPVDQVVNVHAMFGSMRAVPHRAGVDDAGEISQTLAGTVRIRGLAVDAGNGEVLANARVRMVPVGAPGGRDPRSLNADRQGRFTAGAVIPGDWNFTIEKRDYPRQDPERITLEASEHDFELELTLDPGPVVSGTVTGGTGDTIRARVDLFGTTPEGRSFRRRADAGPDGTFRFVGLQGHEVRLVVRSGGHRRAELTAIRVGEERLQVRLEANAP